MKPRRVILVENIAGVTVASLYAVASAVMLIIDASPTNRVVTIALCFTLAICAFILGVIVIIWRMNKNGDNTT